MPKIEAVFFWLGGVITETIPEAIARLLYGVPLARVPIEDRLRIRELAEELYTGQTSAPTFCQRVIEQSEKPCDSYSLAAQIKETVSGHNIVLDVVDALPDSCERWLLCDYPPEWAQVIANRLELSGHFSEVRTLFTASSGLARLVPDVFYYLAHQAGKPLASCLMIDANSARAVQAVRHRLQSTIYVDAKRLRRDFIMRRLLPQPPGFVMPGPRPSN